MATIYPLVGTEKIKDTYSNINQSLENLNTELWWTVKTSWSQEISGIKTFLSGMLGLRNVANTFTSFFSNTNTASRTYTLQDSSDTIVGRATTDTLTNKTISGASNTMTVDGTNEVGFKIIPQNSQSTAYTLVLSDAGKHIYHPSADTTARTWTIPANSSVAYPIGTAITFINDTSAWTLTISITTDTLVLAWTGSTWSRTITANGIATATKVTSTRWIINWVNLT